MSATAELLNYIHQNAQMGQDTLYKLLKTVQNAEFKKLLNSQFDEYKKIFDESEQMLNGIGIAAKDNDMIVKLRTSALDLGRKLLAFEQQNIEECKKFL